MKKILLMSLLVIISTTSYTMASTQYSSKYAKNFQECTPYQENVYSKINQNLSMKTEESIIGRKNNKCVTRSTVYNVNTQETPYKEEKISIIDCQFSQEQVKSLAIKMNAPTQYVNIKQKLEDELAGYITDPNVCKITNLQNQSQN